MRESLINRVGESLDYARECATHSIRRNIWGLSNPSDYSYPSKSFVYFLEHFIWMSTAKFCTFTAEQQGTAPHLDPSLEAVLRSHAVHDEINMNFSCNDVLSQAVFVALDSSEEGLRSMAKDAFGIDLSTEGGFIHKREMAKVIASWKESRIQSESETKVDAVARAHGEPVSYLPSEWVKILKTFKDKYGQRIPEYCRPAQCYFEVFVEEVNEGRLRAETLAQVISLEEEEAQERSKPEHPKQLHLTLKANLTLQTRRRFISQMPTSVEQLRTKYQVLSNLWLLAKLRQPGRALYRDLDERTWHLLLEELLNRKNFAFQRQLENSEVMVGPDWNHCLEYEFQIRKEALRRTEEDGLAIGAALWASYSCPQHRMEQLITFLTVANARSDKDKQTKNTALENKVNAVEKQLANIRNNISRSPRKQLALTEKPWAERSSSRGGKSRGRGKSSGNGQPRGTSKNSKPAPASSKGSKTFETIQKKHGLTLFNEKARSSPGICFRFQKHVCFDSGKCGREHLCIGCGKAGVPYNDCFCLESSA